MGKLIKADFLKLSKSLGYKIWLFCVCGISIFIAYTNLQDELINSAYNATVANGYTAYLSSLKDPTIVMLFAGILAAIFVCNEFSNRTFSMSMFSGCSRRSILLSKAFVFFIGLMPSIFVSPVASSVMLSSVKGFGDLNAAIWTELIQITLLSVLGYAAIGGIFFMAAVLIKNTTGTICSGLGILAVSILGEFPATLSQHESAITFIAVAAITLAITLGAAVFVFQKTELK
jgi:ABC-type transport system involved in multi-copper enzyme maturation permease subunit